MTGKRGVDGSSLGALQRSNDRVLPADFAGDVFVWDIDKTYLDTRFSSLRGLLAIPFELAIDKRAVPGTVPLLRGLRHGPDDVPRLSPLYFVSGSPPVLRTVIERKMTLDGVQFDGITFKDQLALLRQGKPKAITEQLGYKLKALLLLRRDVPAAASYWMFGDDVERDAEVFLLFGAICAGLRDEALRTTLRERGCFVDDIERVVHLCDGLEVTADPVARVFIHESRGGDRVKLNDTRVVLTRSFLQTALVCADAGLVGARAVAAVAEDVEARARGSAAAFIDDAVRRLGVSSSSTAWAQAAL